MIYLITALDSNNLIGKDNQLPWHYPQDLCYFKQMTVNQNVLMGYETYKSLKQYFKTKPFNFNKTYVASFNKDLQLPDSEVVNDLSIFWKKFVNQTTANLFVIGGGKIYQQAIPYVDILYITHILERHQGNVYFPPINWQQFQLVTKVIQPQLIFATYQKGKK
ncbi:dihydrofolate reductase ['Fragaria x ananassa' phyllody phytoplasma]|uniref:dihydrofolate reductase n=1 Tax='Fragaria x ananassa' phyllody phytoplasma TaxID=2358428 RepID=A0ABS5K3B4_9MOLU|nr:dihydrofolate reductase ['Fragaria x ananassa' phyllody phytoplasma]MBS2126204.1 dihydrofolate reductase ['Fragaria x ananassa' phyllody phytoplasma]